IYVEGIDGKQVRSRYDWYEFLRWFEDKISSNPDVDVIDTKDKGAKISGTKIMPLKEVIDNYCNVSINYSDTYNYTFNDSELEKVKGYFEKGYEELDLLKEKAEKARDLCNNQIEEYKKNQEETYLSMQNYKKLSKLNKEIGEMSVYNLLDSYITVAAANELAGLYRFSDNEQEDRILTYNKSNAIFKAIIDAVDFVKPLLGKSVEQI
ncbi:MAG TPA: motility associated factor glycosyltransferase family protein, partial [Clostridiales bacterium]|nr:motility associated factor glycosyltransferase family protein [Clostridiales bacterium]